MKIDLLIWAKEVIGDLITEIRNRIEMIRVRNEVRKVSDIIHYEMNKPCPICKKREIAIARIKGLRNGYLLGFRCLECDHYYEIEVKVK